MEITDAEAASAAQSLALQGSSPFDLDFNDPNTPSIRWIDFYLKPVFSSADSLPATIAELRTAVAAFVADGGSGQVYVIHGDGFDPAPGSPPSAPLSSATDVPKTGCGSATVSTMPSNVGISF